MNEPKAEQYLKMLNADQVAKIFGVSVRTVHGWKARGKLPFAKIGGALRFHPDDIERLSNTFRHEKGDI